MSRPLLKRTSSISKRIEQERSQVHSAVPEHASDVGLKRKANEKSANDKPILIANDFGQEDDTDSTVSPDSDAEVTEAEELEDQTADNKQLQRYSSRIVSLTKHGKLNLERFKSIRFQYFANDYLAIRAEGNDFYLCRVLEDVQEDKEDFKIAWLERVDKDKQHYKISYDDTCYQASVIDRVKLDEVKEGKYHLNHRYLKQVRKLLKEALQSENGDHVIESSEDEPNESDSNEEKEELDEDAPPAKRRRRSVKKEKMKNEKKDPKQTKTKHLVRRGLVPNPDIKLVNKDPLFEEKNALPIVHVKRGIRAVLLNDMQMLKDAIEDVDNVYSIFWDRSSDIKLDPVCYALLAENKEALDLLRKENHPKERKAKRPTYSLSKMNTGRYNFFTFGHAVREIMASRGAKEGNDAFVKESDSSSSATVKFCLKRNLSPEIISYHFKDTTQVIGSLNVAIKNGHRKLAAHYLIKEAENNNLGSYGFNFLHKEVLANDTEPLSKFKVQSCTKKTYLWNILPLHCAAINPNPKYLQALFSSVPNYQVKDSIGRKLIHYAAACEGPGPLNFLLSRGADPTDVDTKGTTPLMIAAKLGRLENVKELMKAKVDVDIDNEDEDDDEGMEGGSTVKEQNQVLRIDINAKHRKTTKAAIHYAAKNGHESTVRLLVEQGATVGLQTGASKGNMTALTYAAEQGHLHVVKTLIELGAAPDGKVRHRKTALMIAAQNGHYKVMAYLLHIGVNPNAGDSSLNTAIHYAAAYGWYHCVKLLLEAGADPNVANNWKTTPLAIALLKDNIHCADLLLSADVNVDFPNEEGATVMMSQLLLEFGDSSLEKVRFLVEKKGADVNCKDMNGSSALHYLASNSVFRKKDRWSKSKRQSGIFDKGSSDICNAIAGILIKAGADVNAVKEDGYTPLMVALLQNNFPLVEILLQNGASTNTSSETKSLQPPLQLLLSKTEILDLIELFDDASKYKNIDEMSRDEIDKIYANHDKEIKNKFFKILIDFGADLNSMDEDGTTALMITIQQGSTEKTKKLLSNGANPQVGQNVFGQNTFHVMAASCTKPDSSAILSSIAKKFKLTPDFINQVDNDGYTPILLACEALANGIHDEDSMKNGQTFIQVLIEKCHADVDAYVTQKKIFAQDEEHQKHRSLPTLGLVVEKDKKIDEDPFGLTGKFNCLHFLAMVQQQDSSSNLIKIITNAAKSDLINARCRHGRTPLHQAIKSRNSYAVSQLIKAGSDVSLPSENSERDGLLTPLSLAARPPFQIDTVKELLKANVDVNVKSPKDGQTALSFAVTNVSGSASDASTLDLVKAIVASGADINSRDDNQRTPLHHLVNASSGGYESLTEVEEFLLHSGADICATDASQRMPIFYAFCNFQSDEEETNMIDPISIVSLICDHAEKNNLESSLLSHEDIRQRTIMHYAALRGASISCLHMLKHHALPSEIDEDGNTPVSLALRSGHHGCAMILLQHNSKLRTWDVISPITKMQLKKYEDECEQAKWRCSADSQLVKPEAVKKSAFQVTVENHWPGVAYMILEYGGIPILDAFKASLKAGDLSLAWSLLKRQRNPDSFLAVDESGCNMLHILATHASLDESHNGTVVQIAKFLMEKNVDPTATDSDSVLPLHLASQNSHFGLCQLFLDCSVETLNKSTKEGYTPVAAVFNAAVNNAKIEDKHVELIKYFVSKGVKTFDVCYFTGTMDNDDGPESTTILNDLILLENDGNFAEDTRKEKQGSIEYLLANGADINFANHSGMTPLMTAVDCDYLDMVKLLLSYKKIKLDLVTKNGLSLAHLCIQSLDGFYKERKEIFKLLIKKGISLEHVDKFGHTPLYYALKQPTGGMASLFPARLRKNINPEPLMLENVFPFQTKIDEHWIDAELHVKEHAMAELSKLNDIPMKDKTPPVDPAFNMSKTGVVYADESTGSFYDVVLTKVDVRRRMYGVNVFYKLQVVHHKGKELWILFNRWGRIGAEGQHQQTPFNNPQEACDEFKKIFKSKTGNKWESLDSFQKMPNKYSLVINEKNPERMLHRKEEILKPINFEKCPKSKLPKELKVFMEKLVDLPTYAQWFEFYSRRVDSTFMPFGLVSRETIEEAKLILHKIREVLAEKGNSKTDEVEMYEKIGDLSNSLFMMIPPAHYAYERIHPVCTLEVVAEYFQQLDALTELSIAGELLLAAQHNQQAINPLDYVYKGIGVHLEIMDHSSTESQYILEYIKNSHTWYGDRPSIAGIFRIRRAEEDSNFEDCGVSHNRQLLWHGTNSAHVLSILKTGLQLEAKQAMVSGSSLGNGVYFSLSFSKALSYSSYDKYSGFCGFVFLCEVALGDTKVINPSRGATVEDEANCNSISIPCHELPNPEKDVFTPYGAKIRLGPWIESPGDENSFYREHECVVRNHKQVKIRYLVMTK